MFTRIKNIITPSDKRKDVGLRKAFEQIEKIAEHSNDYYAEVFKTQQSLEKLYSIERKRSKTTFGVLKALEVLVEKELSFDDQLKKILEILVNTAKIDRAFVFEKDKKFISLINNLGEVEDFPISSKRNIFAFPKFKDRILSGKHLFIHRNNLTITQKDLLPEATKSLFLLPVFEQKDWWGLLGMSVSRAGTGWDANDRMMLTSFGNIFSGILKMPNY